MLEEEEENDDGNMVEVIENWVVYVYEYDCSRCRREIVYV